MIVSHRHRFIFLKTQKTAGSSIELFLRRFCGPDDIVTPVDPDEPLAAELGLDPPRNYGDRLARPWEWRRRDLHTVRTTRALPRRSTLRDHSSAAEVRAVVGQQVWDEYLTFTVVRNPWDQAVSSYFWMRSLGRGTDDEVMDIVTTRGAARNWGIYTIDGAVAVDEVIRYEDLAAGLARVCARIGLAAPVDLPRAKAGIRPARTHWRDVLTDDQAATVARHAAGEIAEFGYRFDD